VTLEAALGAGASSDKSTGAVAFAIGGWLTRSAALAFRVTAAGDMTFVGGSVQLVVTKDLWLGAGAGQLGENVMDGEYDTRRATGAGGFGRVGYQLTGERNVLYLSAELQAGSIEGQSRSVAILALGYQLL
jgi:hypothetical protein